jgi:hypothetical protein
MLKDNGYIEISMEGHLTEVELEEIISELKSAKEKHGSINTLLDFSTLTGYDKMFLDKNDSILSLDNGIERLAAVHRGVTALPFLEYLKNISYKYQKFNEKNIDEARNWVTG